MDYESKRETATDHSMGDAALNRTAADITGMAQAGASAGSAVLIPDASNSVVLPDGATLDDITVRGRDLVIVLDDGRTFIIPDGAVYVPQIVAQGVAVPPLNLAALLVGSEPEPAAGPVRSSGGNFEVPVDPLQAAYDLGDLLPYTELAFPEPNQREIFPPIDRRPETGPNAAVQLDDDARPGGNAGGTGDDADSVNVTGTLVGTGGDGALTWSLATTGAPAGFSYVANGTGLDILQGTTVVVRVTLNTATGAYVVTQAAPINHTAGEAENNTQFTLSYTVTDSDGDTAAGTIDVNVDDDTPVTANDTDTVSAGTYGPATGNVLTDASAGDAGDSDTGADSMGADGGTLTAIRGAAAGTIGGTTAGTYGVLTLNADGSYSYVRNPGTPGGVTDVFTYTVTDRDGDTATATLTITIADALPLTSENRTVLLDDDALAGGNTGGTGDDADAAGLSGTLAASGGDGPLTWALSTANAPSGFTYTANGTGIDVMQGTTLVMQVTLNSATGAYTVTQVAPIDHAAGLDENNTAFAFGYTVTDQDGDSASGMLNVNVDDDTPTSSVVSEGEVSALIVDETTLVGTSAENFTGLFAQSFGADGAGTITYGLGVTAGPSGLVDTLSGESVVLSMNGTVVEGRTATGGLLVFTASVDASGNVTLNQHRAVIHDPNAGPDDVVSLASSLVTLTQTVTDSDGDSAVAVANIGAFLNFVDDAPSASNDTDSIASGSYGPATGNVLTDASTGDTGDSDTGTDSLGNDGGEVTAITGSTGPGTIGGTTAGTYGVLTLNPDGSYSYVRNPGTPGGVSDVFTYTVTDGDGDTATATLTITIADAAPITAANGAVQLDDDAQAGGNAGGTGDDADAVNVTGTLTGSGGDGPLTWQAVSFTSPVGFTPTLVNPGLIEVRQGGTLVFTIAFNTATGAYTITQVAPIDHSALGDENNTGFSFGYRVIDQDGDIANGSIAINIDDDTPVVSNDTDSVASGTYGPEIGNVLTGLGTTSGAAGADSLGADGAAAGGAVTAISGAAAGTIGGTTAGTYGVLTLNADGSYSYVRNAGTPGGVSDVFTYTVTDGDGDTATATLTIDIADALPLTGENRTVLLDDDTQAGGNAGGTGDDADAAGLTGTLAASGGDGPLVWALSTANAPSGFTYTANGTGIDVMQGTTLVMQVTLNSATGAYTVTQVAPIDHAAGLDENNTEFTFSYTVTDQDSDNASGTLTVNVDDDTPLASSDTDTVAAGTYGPETGNVFTGAGTTSGVAGADSIGADGAATPGPVTAVSGTATGTIGGATAGTYGSLTLNADGSYSYVRNAGTPGGVSDTFTYSITDADGDTATATLIITIADALPVTALNATVLLDDDALAGGNTGGTGDNADAANTIGTLAGSGGDGPLVWALSTAGAPSGFNYVANGTGINVMQGTTLVMQVTLNPATGAYTATQVAPIDHAAGLDENNTAFAFGYSVTDQDGDSASGTLNVNVDDDTSVLANDTDEILSGSSAPATGNVLTDTSAGDDGDSDTGADSVGADGGTLTAISGSGGAGTIGGTTNGTYGVLTLNADGSYSYVRNAGTPGDVSDVFTYTVTDGDGDVATATLTITIRDAAPITTPNATVLLDDDTQAGGNAGGTGDDADGANLSGTLSGSGGDGALTWALATSGAPSGFTYNANGSGINIMQGATLVMQVTLNPATGAYTVTQVAAIDHVAGLDENNQGFTLSYTVTDSDGDSANGTLGINVDDDTPVVTVSGTGPLLTVDESNFALNSTSSFSSVFTNAIGADGAGGSSYTLGVVAGASGLIDTLTGQAVNLSMAGSVVEGRTTGGLLVFTLSVDGSGNVTLDQSRAVIHDPNAGPNDIETLAANLITLTRTITDGDGDSASATANIGDRLRFVDDAPSALAGTTSGTVDEDGLPGGIAGGVSGDVAGEAISASGSVTGLFQAGADSPLSYSLSTNTAGLPALTSGGTSLVYSVVGNVLTATAGATPVFTLTLNATTGQWTFALLDNLDHAAGATENDIVINFGSLLIAADADGDTVAATGSLLVTIDDDMPTVAGDTDAVTEDGSTTATGNVISGTGSDGNVAGADGRGADGAAITAVGPNGAPIAGNLGTVFNGTHGTLTLDALGNYTYVLNNSSPAVQALDSGETLTDTFTYVLTDGDSDGLPANLVITITGSNDTPVVSPGTAIVSEEGLGGANVDGVGSADTTNSAVAGGTIVASDVDVEPLTFSLGNPGAVLTADGSPVTWSGVGTGTLIGSVGLVEVIRIAINPSTGAYTVTLSQSVDHPGLNIEDNVTFIVPVSVSDGTATTGTTLTITIEDDSPTATNDPVTTIEGAPTINGNVLTNDSVGADTPGSVTNPGTYNLGHGTLVINANGSYSFTPNASVPSGTVNSFVYTMRDSDGDTAQATLSFTFQGDANLPTAGTANASVDDDALAGGIAGGTGDLADANADGDNNQATFSGTLPRDFGLDGPGVVTLANMNGLTATVGTELVTFGWNAGSGTLTATITGGARGGTALFTVQVNASTGAYTVTQLDNVLHASGSDENDASVALTYQVTDSDSSVANGTLNITFDDDTPTASASTTQPMLVVDETLLTANASASFASVFTTAFGADGAAAANSLVYTLGINAGATGLFDVATGSQVVLTIEAGQVVGRAGAGGLVVFTLSVATNGTVTLDQQRAVLHNDPADHDEPGASAAVLLADNLITLTATATDADGDQATATANIAQNLQFEDDGPTITSVTTPLTVPNTGSVSATGNFVFSTGNDGAAGVNDAIQSVTFGGTVNGVAVGSPTIVAGAENATTANFSFSFTYATGASSTVTATGTLVFDKVLGTYTVDLDAPIQSFSVTGTASGTAFLGYELNSSASDGSQPAVSVTQISTNLFLQFTGISEPSSGTGSNNLGTVNYGLDSTPPSDGANLSFSNGELFNQAAGWVSISNTANGVNGDTIGGGEVLDFNLYNSNPQGFVGTTPTASTSTMYLKFDGIGAGEDFILVLKLWNPTTGEYTTRALMVQNSDIQKGPGSGSGAFAGITLDNNDGLIVIESNDYNGVGENFVIVGAQIAGSDEGITGTAINFSNTTGAGGASTGTQAFSTDSNDGPMKISDIGFVVNTSTTQAAQLTFGVTVQDRDGDTASQTLVVNVGGVPPVAMDLDGDGVEFLSASAGVAFDYNGDGSAEGTAWVGADDGLLAIDRNGDGLVNDGSEIIFAGAGQTDLQGLAASYDSNGDGQLTATDAAFAQFGVWQDANSDGVTQAGEFRSLADMGITAIELTSDGNAYAAAGGDVQVAGEADYTMADGSTGTLADASFALTGERQAARSAELVATSTAATGLLAAMAIEHANAAADNGLARASLASDSAAREALFDALPAQAQAAAKDLALPVQEMAAKAAPEANHALSQGEGPAGRGGLDQMADRIADLRSDIGSDNAKSALFGEDHAMKAMDALLAQGAMPAAKAEGAHPALAAALAETAGAEAVDSIVDYFAPNSAGNAEFAGLKSDFDLQGLLNLTVNGSGDDAKSHFSMMPELDHDSASAMA